MSVTTVSEASEDGTLSPNVARTSAPRPMAAATALARPSDVEGQVPPCPSRTRMGSEDAIPVSEVKKGVAALSFFWY